MIPIDFVWIVLLASYMLAFAASIVFASLSMSSDKKANYSFLRNFPYEIPQIEAKVSKFYKVFIFIFAGLCFAPILDIVPNIAIFGDMGIFAIVISCVYGLAGLSIVALHMFEAKFVKVHSIVVTCLLAFSLLANALTAVYSGVTYKVMSKFGEGRVVSIVLLAFSALLALAIIVLAVNPKLKNWAKLDVSEENGEKKVSRPHVFILALTEWLAIAITFVGEIVFYLSLIK